MDEEKLIQLWEHYNMSHPAIALAVEESYDYIFVKKNSKEECRCVHIYPIKEGGHKIELSYFVGVDWIIEKKQAIYVAPKLNEGAKQTNYLKMLFSALKHPEVAAYTQDLFEIKWDKQAIEITQQQDLLTPLLVVQFLSIVKEIVRKGLKKSYYKVEHNLYGRVKGKVMIAATIKQNAFKNKPLNTWCSYDEFGLNGLENRLLKKALVFVQRYFPQFPNIGSEEYLQQNLGYILPAFETVSEEVNLHDILHTHTNPFYKEYKEGLGLAKLILKRFGYNITNTQTKTIQTPPFWIDMAKLFELYVLGLLKDRFDGDVLYHFKANGNELDYLLDSPDYKMVIDAKYKLVYQEDGNWDIENIRQVSGYARLIPVHEKLYGTYNDEDARVIDCLIIYPEALSNPQELMPPLPDDLVLAPIDPFSKFHKMAVKIPVIRPVT